MEPLSIQLGTSTRQQQPGIRAAGPFHLVGVSHLPRATWVLTVVQAVQEVVVGMMMTGSSGSTLAMPSLC